MHNLARSQKLCARRSALCTGAGRARARSRAGPRGGPHVGNNNASEKYTRMANVVSTLVMSHLSCSSPLNTALFAEKCVYCVFTALQVEAMKMGFFSSLSINSQRSEVDDFHNRHEADGRIKSPKSTPIFPMAIGRPWGVAICHMGMTCLTMQNMTCSLKGGL